MVQCPSCARRCEPCLICPGCGSPIAADIDCFAALGLPRRLTIDPSLLERTYHEFGRRLHPDRFAVSSEALRNASLKSTALLTRSYRTLRDPASRGLYWLELNGEKLAENNQLVPAEIADLVFEVQEQLAELRGLERNGGALGAIEARRSQLAQLMEETNRELSGNFAQLDAGNGSGNQAPLIAELKRILSRRAYLRTLLRDVDRALETARAA